MYKNKVSSNRKVYGIGALIIIAFFFDLIFGVGKIPILTSIVCGIVAVYECVSPFIYTSR
jgi:TM2 domain-containing membrane protein YozV